MVTTTPTRSSCYVSSLAIIQGEVDPTDVRAPPCVLDIDSTGYPSD
jgi:hypothetical protein